MSNTIQDLLRDKPPVMILDMGLGSREQGFSVQTPKRVPVDGPRAGRDRLAAMRLAPDRR